MANVVASILATLGLDARSFKAEIAAVEKTATGFGSTLLGIPNLGSVLGAAGIGIALKGVIDYGAEVQHLSDRFQVSTDSIQKFGNAAEQNGVSMESVARAFAKLEKAQAQALQGNDQMAAAFIGLGVSVGDLKSLTPDQIMEKIGHSSMNAADLVKVLGRNGLELRPILQGLADGTIEYGKAINSIDIKRLEEADKAWKKIFETMRVFGAESVSRAIEALKDLRLEAQYDAAVVINAWTSVGDVFSKLFSGRISKANAAAKEFYKNFSVGAAAKQLLFPSKETFEPPGKKEEPQKKAPAATEEDVAGEGKRAEKAEVVKGENAVLRAQLDHLDAIAKALGIHFEIEKKIFAARDSGNSALVTQLQLQEKLSIQKIAEEVASKNAERGKLSLKELAAAGPIGRQGFFSEDTLKARRAVREEQLGERERLAQHPEAALRHFDLAEQIKASIPGLKDTEKDISGQVRMGNDTSSVFQQMIGKMDALLNMFSG